MESKKSKIFTKKLIALFLSALMALTCFTGVLTAYARAVYRLSQKGDYGCKTVFDIAPALLSPLSGEDLRAHML